MPSTTSTAIRVRTYAPRDQTAIIEMFKAGMLSYIDPKDEMMAFAEAYFQESINGDLGNIETAYMGSGGHFWVATSEDEVGNELVVGMVGLEGKPDKAYELRRMSVRADYRRHGVGKILVETLEQWAREQGLEKVWLSTGDHMLQAQKFYASMGFTHVKTETILPEGFKALFYEKTL